METIKIEAKREKLETMINFIIDNYAKHDHDPKSIHKLRLVAEEALINIIDYAYPEIQGEIELAFDFNPSTNQVFIRLKDNGVPFNPLELKDPDLNSALEDREIGGLGVFIIKKIMDEVQYERKNEQNILSLSKKLKNHEGI